MVAAMCTSIFYKVQHRLGNSALSKCLLRMANGAIEPSKRWWEGLIKLCNVMANGQFEVFDSQGGWEFLFSKPLLQLFKATHKRDHCPTQSDLGMPKFGSEPRFEPRTPEPDLWFWFSPVLVLSFTSRFGRRFGASRIYMNSVRREPTL